MNKNKTCKYLCDEVCCNDSSPFLADFPSEEDCKKCHFFDKKVTFSGKNSADRDKKVTF